MNHIKNERMKCVNQIVSLLGILPVTSQLPDPGLSKGNEEWEEFVLGGFAYSARQVYSC